MPATIKEPGEGVIRVGSRPVVVQCLTRYHGSDLGYSKEAWLIKAIYDKNGNSLDPVFKTSWTEIAPGIATCNPGENRRYGSNQEVCEHAIRISSEACPVKIIFAFISEYNDYDDYQSYTNKKEVKMLFQRQE